MAYTATQRSDAIKKVLAGLRKGTPLTVICGGKGMPGYTTIWQWTQDDPELSEAIARAREEGFDQIAQDALAIADATAGDTITSKQGQRPNKEWIDRSKLRVETRLKLLAKWDPKRYGEKVQHAGHDGGELKLTISSEDAAL